jgi:hypothetical protein
MMMVMMVVMRRRRMMMPANRMRNRRTLEEVSQRALENSA